MSRDPDPIGRDLTRTRAERRLPDGARCALCGERDGEVLAERRAKSVSRSVLEAHHVAGQANDPDLTVTLCLNCHQRFSARMPTRGMDLLLDPDRSVPERLVAVLRGLALLFEQLAASLTDWARQLAQTIDEYPEEAS